MIAKHKGEIPVVILLLPFLGGISVGLYYPATKAMALGVSALILIVLFIVFNIAYRRFQLYKSSWVGSLLVYPILLLAGWLTVVQHNQLNSEVHFSKHTAEYLLVHINSEPKVKGDVVRFSADVVQGFDKGKPIATGGMLLLSIKDQLATNLFYGEELLIPAKYATVEPPYNPGEFNYRQYLAGKNIHHQAYLYPKQYRVIKGGCGNPVIAYALKTRQNLVTKLRANMSDTTAIAVASTLILGYKADLSNDVLQAYSKTGTIHILSVSGGHVAIIYGLLAWALGLRKGASRSNIIKAISIILLIWVYALLTGFSPAVNRAALMISMIILGRTFARYINSLNILACSAFILLLYAPYLLTDVGFQLSYLAVVGLVVFQPIVYQWFSFKNKWGDKIWMACSVSIAAQVITFPLSAYYFHQAPVYFLISNLLIVLPVAVIMYAGMALLVLPQIPYLSKALGFVLEHTILLMNKALAFIEHIPFASIGKIWLTRPEHLLLYIIITAAFYFIYNMQRKWLLFVSLSATLLFCISISFKKLRADGTQSVTFLNLRKNTGIIFKNGPEGVVLTNLADTDKAFQYAIQPGLDSMRVTHYSIIGLSDSFSHPWFIKQQNLVQFFDTRILLLNQLWPLQSIPKQTGIGYLYVSNNAQFGSRNLSSQVLIADGSNSDAYIDKLKNIPVNCRILKRNKSFNVASKQ